MRRDMVQEGGKEWHLGKKASEKGERSASGSEIKKLEKR